MTVVTAIPGQGLTEGFADGAYLRLDASNDPITDSLDVDVTDLGSGGIATYINLTDPPFPTRIIAAFGVGESNAQVYASFENPLIDHSGYASLDAAAAVASLLLSATNAANLTTSLTIGMIAGVEVAFNALDAVPIVFYTDGIERFRIDETGGNLALSANVAIEGVGGGNEVGTLAYPISDINLTGFISRIVSNTAGVDPGVSDDNTQGYSVGSRWINTAAVRDWVCLNAGTGVADWQETTGGGATLPTYAVQVDEVSGSITYIGEAAPGAATSASVWRIKRLDESSDPELVLEWADGDSNFDNVFDNRASLSYS